MPLGMLASVDTISMVSKALEDHKIQTVVVDPVGLASIIFEVCLCDG